MMPNKLQCVLHQNWSCLSVHSKEHASDSSDNICQKQITIKIILQHRKSGGFIWHNYNHILSFGSHAFRISAPQVYNSVPLHIRQAQTFTSFRRHLKLIIFSLLILSLAFPSKAPWFSSAILALYKLVLTDLHSCKYRFSKICLDWAVNQRISSSYVYDGRNISSNVIGVQRDQSRLGRLVDIGHRPTAGWLVEGRMDFSAGAASQLTHQSYAPQRILLLCSIVVATLTCWSERFGWQVTHLHMCLHTVFIHLQRHPLAMSATCQLSIENHVGYVAIRHSCNVITAEPELALILCPLYYIRPGLQILVQ